MKQVRSIDDNFLGIGEEHSSYDKSDIVVLPVPYEETVSYGTGTGNGPEAIIEASRYVEFWDEQFRNELCFEHGIATLPPLDFKGATGEAAIRAIEAAVKEELEAGKFVATLGGEHSISSATIKAHYEKYPNMSVLQFDAHSDLRQEYEGTPWSHASVMARVLDFFPPDRLTQLGIRAQCKEEYMWIKEAKIQTFFARALRQGTYSKDWMDVLTAGLRDEVYITFDVDYFDPGIMPSTGTPEPGGFGWDETMGLLLKIAANRRIVGFDIVELAPDENNPAPTYLAAKLAYKLMNFAFTPPHA